MSAQDGGPGPPSSISKDNNVMEIENINSTENNSKIKQRPEFKYTYLDSGPFEIYMQSKNNLNIGNYNQLALAKEVFNLKLNDIMYINKKGRNRISVIFKSYTAANNFIDNDTIKSKGYEMFIPTNNVTCKGIIRQVDSDIPIELIKEASTCKVKNIDILDMRRLNRKESGAETKYVATGTICVTFRGKILPREIYIWGMGFRVTPYIMPVIQCYNCMLFGHTQKQCRGKTKCSRCGKTNHEGNECRLECYFCGEEHSGLGNKNCQEYLRQKKIKEIMSLDNLSYYDASNQVPGLGYRKKKEFTQQQDDFPSLRNKNGESGIIPVSNRRTEYNSRDQGKRTYSEMCDNNTNQPSTSRTPQTINTGAKRKNINQAYDMTEHNKILMYPNGRYRGEDSPQPMYTPNQQKEPQRFSREEIASKTMEDIMFTASKLSTSCREMVLNYMTQLIMNDTYTTQNNLPNFNNEQFQ